MLKSLTLDEINAIISAAKALNAKHPASETGIFASEITTEEIEAYSEDEEPLVGLLSALSHDALMELMALMWIGRDFDGDFNDALKYARENSDAGNVPYIAEKSPALPTYLRNGLQMIGMAAVV
jgi:hypothetical protein